MAKRDFDTYYDKVASQYFQMLEQTEALAKDLDSGMVDPNVYKSFQQTLEPIKTNWQTLSYIKYLLDKPAKKVKHSRYETSSKLKKNSGNRNGEILLSENEKILNNIPTTLRGG